MVLLLSTTTAVVLACGLALAAPAHLDAGFDGDGKVVTDFGGNEEAQEVAVQPDGKIVAVGHASPSAPGNEDPVGTQDMLVMRHKADGSLDGSFGNAGKRIVDFGPGYE